ncbi:MAG: AAA family ATPase [Nannocystaceae bacterium]
MKGDIRIYQFGLWKLALLGVGPFRGQVERISFRHTGGEPSNLFLIMAPNGRGKTTALEAVYFLMSMLDPAFSTRSEVAEHDFFGEPNAKLQLDLLMQIGVGQAPERRVLLSLSWGDVGDTGLSGWTESPLEDGVADYWLRIGYSRDSTSGGVSEMEYSVDALRGWERPEEPARLLSSLRELIASGSTEAWTGFSGSDAAVRPTVLYFASGRDITRDHQDEHRLGRPSVPQYRVAHRFEREGGVWASSLENLLVWFYWLSPVIYEEARTLVNQLVFDGGIEKQLEATPQKDPPGVRVGYAGESHGLDRLSSGERNLTQFALRYHAHRTRFTVLLIDEIELHLHQEFRRKLVQLLKDEVSRNADGTTVVFTSHDDYVIDEVDLDTDEDPVRKMPHFVWR